jgi:hypothetical protein
LFPISKSFISLEGKLFPVLYGDYLMAENQDAGRVENTAHPKRRLSRLAIASLVLGILLLPIAIISIRRISTVQSPSFQACLVQETPAYRAVHSLCVIVPTASIMFGILALMRVVRSRRKLSGTAFAVSGIAISIAVFIIYLLNLISLASGHAH